MEGYSGASRAHKGVELQMCISQRMFLECPGYKWGHGALALRGAHLHRSAEVGWSPVVAMVALAGAWAGTFAAASALAPKTT